LNLYKPFACTRARVLYFVRVSEPIELKELYVTIDRIIYSPQLQAPTEKPYPFIYFITIHNQSDRKVTIKGRKWVVTDETGDKLIVEGDGVVGQTPEIASGESFSYNSYHTIACDSIAEGAYIGLDEFGQRIITRIPKFKLEVPHKS